MMLWHGFGERIVRVTDFDSVCVDTDSVSVLWTDKRRIHLAVRES